jgi:hypothetical protein
VLVLSGCWNLPSTYCRFCLGIRSYSIIMMQEGSSLLVFCIELPILIPYLLILASCKNSWQTFCSLTQVLFLPTNLARHLCSFEIEIMILVIAKVAFAMFYFAERIYLFSKTTLVVLSPKCTLA